nr:MAG TPA: hypothetical protein [Bacteriophage sp.]
MNKKDILQEAKTKTQVDKAYIDYQKFVKVPKMPVYKFKYIKQQGTTIAEERNENNTYYLIISDKLCTPDYKSIAKGILYHEFTHILDEEELVNKYGFSHNERNTMYVYKEIHAEQIKTLYLLGCKTIDDLGSIDKDRISFQHNKKLYKIYDYLIAYQEELRNNIKLIEYAKQNSTKISVYEFNNILNRIFYYVGTASIYIKYCDVSVYNQLDVKDVWEYYGYGTNFLLKEFVKNDVGFHTKELIEAMAKLRNLLIQHFDKFKIIDATL